MAAKKKPAYQDPSKKNRATTKDKPNTSNRTDVNGRSGMGVSSTRSTFESRTGIRTNKTLNSAQNVARSIVVGGVAKTILNKVVSKAVSKPKSNLTGSGTYVTPNKNAAKEYAGRGGAGTKTNKGKDVIPPNTYGTPNKKLAEQYAKKKKK